MYDLAAQFLHMTRARQAEAKASIPPPRSDEEIMGLSILPGDRVLDTISGEEGVVLSGRVQHSLIPTTPAANAAPGDDQTSNRRAGGA